MESPLDEFDYSLQKLIHPLSKDSFLSEYWTQKPFIINRDDRSYYKSLLSMDMVDDLITSIDFTYPDINVVTAQEDTELKKYTVNGDKIVVAKLFHLFAEGHTIILNSLDHRLSTLSNLCRALETELNMPCQTNVYLTPANAQGFKVHYDTHDVFILQIDGVKHWKFYGRAVTDPLDNLPFDEKKYPVGLPTEEFLLKPGDVAYIPRGWLHEAVTNNESSLHITFGIIPYTWSMLMEKILSDLSEKEADFRKCLPVDYMRQGVVSPEMNTHFQKLLAKIASKSSYEGGLNLVIDEFISSRKPDLKGQFRQIMKNYELPLDKPLVKRRSLILRISETPELIQINCFGKVISFPISLKIAVNYIFETETIYIKDIPINNDINLKVAMVQKLLREGILMYKGL